jgi:hypothetical protein
MSSTAPVTTAEHVADLLATVAAANERITVEADRISGARAAVVNLATVNRLTRLAVELRSGAEARAQLSRVDVDLLLDGTALWLARRRDQRQHVGPIGSAPARVAARWGSGPA